jgi:hypothetical protein
MSGNTLLGWGGDSDDSTALFVGVAKLETFCRNLEDRIDRGEKSVDDVVKIRIELDELKGKASELKARIISIEDLIDDVESARNILKLLNPKTIIGTIGIILGTSVGGNQVVEKFTNNKAVVEDKVDNQDAKFDVLTKRIQELEKDNK